MRVKKYLANSEQEAIEQIKSDQGNNAIILGTRKVKKGGFFGFFGKTMLEVTVACEPNSTSNSPRAFHNKDYAQTKKPHEFNQLNNSNPDAHINDSKSKKVDQFKQLREMIEKRQKEYNSNAENSNTGKSSIKSIENDRRQEKPKNPIQNQSEALTQNTTQSTKNGSFEELKRELYETQTMMNDVISEFRQTSFESRLPRNAQRYFQLLVENDIQRNLSQQIISQVLKEAERNFLQNLI